MPEIPSPQPEAVPRPFNAVKAFADSVLAMLDERIKAAERNAHPFMDKFGDHPETIVAAKAQASELREVRTQVRILGDRSLVELMKFKPAARESDRQLMDFYSVDSLHALIDAQEEHIRRLQAKLPPIDQPAFTRVREG